ncbi:MAG: SPOR domain-containing protein, partial [Gammaproteobacteria bacterium]
PAATPAKDESGDLATENNAVPESDLVSSEPVLENSIEELSSAALEQNTTSEPSVPDYSDSERLLLDASETTYVVQIAGLSNPDSVRRLIAAHPEVNLLSYRSILNGKPWQIVVAGPFENYAAASQERSQLPESLAVNKPWLKSIIKVKEEIETAVAK